MAIDPVTREAMRRPLFLAGVILVLAGLVPLILDLTRPGGPAGFPVWISIPIGAVLMALGRERASREWRERRAGSGRS